MALYLIRHGETAENARRVLQLPGVPLSERGVGQAEALAGRLADVGIVRILSSDLRRAAMTAEALRRATGAVVEHEPLLQERSFGALRGRAYAELEEDPFAPGFVPPEGESEVVFLERTALAWQRVERMVAESDGPVAVVTHGLVCRAFVEHRMQAEPTREPPRWGNTCLTIADPAPPWRIRLLACTAHLDEERDGAAV